MLRPPPRIRDQADGLRRLFPASRVSFVAVASNPRLPAAPAVLARLAAACAARKRHVLVVDAGESSPPGREIALLDLALAIETLSPDTSYLPARGLPLRHVDARGSCASWLEALAAAAPHADTIVVHAPAAELGRVFSGREPRPLLLAADDPASVTEAYASMKLLSLRHGLMAFDLLLDASAARPGGERIAHQVARCADTYLGAVLHDWAALPRQRACDAVPGALARLVGAQLAHDAAPLPRPPRRSGAAHALH